MKAKIRLFLLLVIVVSCKTYTISPESFKTQLSRGENNQKQEVEINNPLYFGNLKYQANSIDILEVTNKKGEKAIISKTASLEMKVEHKNGKKYLFYFDTVIIENDTLKGSRSRFTPKLSRSIPFDSIISIKIQEGGKRFDYQKK